jgi:hypothetical protein
MQRSGGRSRSASASRRSGRRCHQEEIEVQTFAAALRASIEEFQADPSGPPLVPNWSRAWAGVHNAVPLLVAAVQ